MSDFVEMETTRKGTMYSCDCSNCGVTVIVHEWATWDNNEARDAMYSGTLHCQECHRPVGNVDVVVTHNVYAGRYSAPGYLDCTDWEYDTNKRRLERTLRDLYEVE